MQKKAIRRIFNAHYDEHTTYYFIELNALFDLLKYKTGLFMYKAYHNSLSKKNHNFLCKYGQVNTRQTGNFQKFDMRTTKKQMCITIGGPKLWNSFDTNLKEGISIQKS